MKFPALLALIAALGLAACGPKPTTENAVLIVGSPAAGPTVAAQARAAGLDPVLTEFLGAEAGVARFCTEKGRPAPDIVVLNRALTIADANACALTGIGYDVVPGPGGQMMFRRASFRSVRGLLAFRTSLGG